jgi:Flp pilus assembly pilin Flp
MVRLTAWATTLRARLGSDEGQTYVEYALILSAVVALVVGLTFTGLGTAIQNALTQVTNAFGA